MDEQKISVDVERDIVKDCKRRGWRYKNVFRVGYEKLLDVKKENLEFAELKADNEKLQRKFALLTTEFAKIRKDQIALLDPDEWTKEIIALEHEQTALEKKREDLRQIRKERAEHKNRFRLKAEEKARRRRDK